MFFNEQLDIQKKEYEKVLKIIWALSNIFSESETPYLYYRIAEKVFCKSFDAEDLSRTDLSVDAKKWVLWIGLKTFLSKNNKSLEKVAEFNSDRSLYVWLEPIRLVGKISELRNARIDFTQKVYSIKSSIYHCIVREKGKFWIYEETMDTINIPKISNVKVNNGSISFNDWKNEYSFLISKSTLTKRFLTSKLIYSFPVEIIKDPLEHLWKLLKENKDISWRNNKIKETIFLPLYWKNHTVSDKSWLNQWNAWWRKRDFNEVYIQVPAVIHKNYSKFFPNRGTYFSLRLPNWKIMVSKICQDWWKALMSKPNKDLWKWLLREVLGLKEWELLTYLRLQLLWIDSIRIDKIDNSNFEINFANIGSYEEFSEWFIL